MVGTAVSMVECRSVSIRVFTRLCEEFQEELANTPKENEKKEDEREAPTAMLLNAVLLKSSPVVNKCDVLQRTQS